MGQKVRRVLLAKMEKPVKWGLKAYQALTDLMGK
jgi:hypothetical protein